MNCLTKKADNKYEIISNIIPKKNAPIKLERWNVFCEFNL